MSVLQRAGSALNIHPHLHLLVADGAWHPDAGGSLRFREAPEPKLAEVAALATAISARLTRMLRRRGLLVDRDPADASAPPLDALASCVQLGLGLGQRQQDGEAQELSDGEPRRPEADKPLLTAVVDGVNVHVGRVVLAKDRDSVERLVRYLLRPAFSLNRLSLRNDGAVLYRLPKPDRRGNTLLVMTPVAFLARLAAIIPAPRFALRRQIGVLASGARDRQRIVPGMPSSPKPGRRSHAHPVAPGSGAPLPMPSRIPWAELLRRVWDLDALRCPACGTRMRPVAVIRDPAEAERYLRHTGEFTSLPPAARARDSPPPAA